MKAQNLLGLSLGALGVVDSDIGTMNKGRTAHMCVHLYSKFLAAFVETLVLTFSGIALQMGHPTFAVADKTTDLSISIPRLVTNNRRCPVSARPMPRRSSLTDRTSGEMNW